MDIRRYFCFWCHLGLHTMQQPPYLGQITLILIRLRMKSAQITAWVYVKDSLILTYPPISIFDCYYNLIPTGKFFDSIVDIVLMSCIDLIFASPTRVRFILFKCRFGILGCHPNSRQGLCRWPARMHACWLISNLRGDFCTSLVKILVFPGPTGYMLWSFGFSLLIWGVFHRFL